MVTIPTATDITRTIVQMDTRTEERVCANYLGSLLEAAGFEVSYYEYAEGHTTTVARLKGSGEKLPIYFGGHIDVVPLGAKPWSVDPFGADIVDGKLYGRGVSDMKAGIAAFVNMGLRIASQPRGCADVVLVMAAGEELGCLGSQHLVTEGVLEKAGALVIAEPTSNYPLLGHRGALWLRVVATGKTAHGSMPEIGDNAIYKAARAVAKLEDHQFDIEPHRLLARTSLCVSTFHGGINVNSVPDRAEFTVDIRSIPGHKHEDILDELERLLGDEMRIIPEVNAAAVVTDDDNPWIQEIYDILEPDLGARPEPRGAPYFTDASALTHGCGGAPTVILGPGIKEQAHQTDEYCYVDDIEKAANIYETIATGWCGLGT